MAPTKPCLLIRLYALQPRNLGTVSQWHLFHGRKCALARRKRRGKTPRDEKRRGRTTLTSYATPSSCRQAVVHAGRAGSLSSETHRARPPFAPGEAIPTPTGHCNQYLAGLLLDELATICAGTRRPLHPCNCSLICDNVRGELQLDNGREGHMPRSKRSVRKRKRACHVCGVEFFAVRDDAKFHSPTCRKKFNRAMQLVLQVNGGALGLKAGAKWKCADCGVELDGRVTRCPVCRSTAKKPNVA